MTGPRLCPVDGCGASLRAGTLLCLKHWRRVPKRLKVEVWSTWRAVTASLGKPIVEHSEAYVAYGFARQAAIDAVHAKMREEVNA